MFKWKRSQGGSASQDAVAEPDADDRDSGEEEYAALEEEAREAGPSGMTRIETDGI